MRFDQPKLFVDRLADYDHVVVNSSGGKDSQTCLREVVRWAAWEIFHAAVHRVAERAMRGQEVRGG